MQYRNRENMWRIFFMARGYTTRKSLLDQVQAGNEEAWREFYQKYRGMIVAIGRNRHLSEEECDELLQDVMRIFWKRMERFTYDPDKGKFRGYLSRITHYAAMKKWNQRGPETVTEESIPEEYGDEVDRALMEEYESFILREALKELKTELSPEVYEAFYLTSIQNRPIQEVASVVGKTPNNLYNIRSRCLEKLRTIINRYRENGLE